MCMRSRIHPEPWCIAVRMCGTRSAMCIPIIHPEADTKPCPRSSHLNFELIFINFEPHISTAQVPCHFLPIMLVSELSTDFYELILVYIPWFCRSWIIWLPSRLKSTLSATLTMTGNCIWTGVRSCFCWTDIAGLRCETVAHVCVHEFVDVFP